MSFLEIGDKYISMSVFKICISMSEISTLDIFNQFINDMVPLMKNWKYVYANERLLNIFSSITYTNPQIFEWTQQLPNISNMESHYFHTSINISFFLSKYMQRMMCQIVAKFIYYLVKHMDLFNLSNGIWSSLEDYFETIAIFLYFLRESC